MASIAENIAYYQDWDWSNAGAEWSHYWGGDAAMWESTIYPRIKQFLPASTIVEIGCGYGRLSRLLAQHAETQLILTDIIDTCVQACHDRFANDDRVICQRTNGQVLAGVKDHSVDLIISFYSLVDTDIDTINNYLSEFDRVLQKDGVAFIHHSNSAEYYDPQSAESNKSMQLLAAYRDVSVGARVLQLTAQQNNLVAIQQECINWDIQEVLSDCFSTIVKPDSKWMRQPIQLENSNFILEMLTAKQGQLNSHR